MSFIIVSNCGLALQYPHDFLKQNKELVITAVKNDPTALKYVDPTIKHIIQSILNEII